jgi:hypothetical protein
MKPHPGEDILGTLDHNGDYAVEYFQRRKLNVGFSAQDDADVPGDASACQYGSVWPLH